jgi:hypothetical protein
MDRFDGAIVVLRRHGCLKWKRRGALTTLRSLLSLISILVDRNRTDQEKNMAITSAIRYRGFVLDCEPDKRQGTRFVAQVIISHEAGQALDEYAFHDLWSADSAALAISYAKAWGRHWVDDYFQKTDLCGQLDKHPM